MSVNLTHCIPKNFTLFGRHCNSPTWSPSWTSCPSPQALGRRQSPWSRRVLRRWCWPAGQKYQSNEEMVKSTFTQPLKSIFVKLCTGRSIWSRKSFCSHWNKSCTLVLHTVLVLRMAHRKWKETKQQPSMLPGLAVPDCCFVSFHFLWAILWTHTVYLSIEVCWTSDQNRHQFKVVEVIDIQTVIIWPHKSFRRQHRSKYKWTRGHLSNASYLTSATLPVLEVSSPAQPAKQRQLLTHRWSERLLPLEWARFNTYHIVRFRDTHQLVWIPKDSRHSSERCVFPPHKWWIGFNMFTPKLSSIATLVALSLIACWPGWGRTLRQTFSFHHATLLCWG